MEQTLPGGYPAKAAPLFPPADVSFATQELVKPEFPRECEYKPHMLSAQLRAAL